MNRRMKRSVFVAAAAASISAGALWAGGETLPPGPQAVWDPSVPTMPRDLGIGERLILVLGGVYPTTGEAEVANAAFDFGEIQGFYVAPVAQFGGLRAQLGSSGPYALVSAFRTLDGARGFAEVAEQAGADPRITSRVVSLGGVFAGLGQEAAPNGSGPLSHSVPASRGDA